MNMLKLFVLNNIQEPKSSFYSWSNSKIAILQFSDHEDILSSLESIYSIQKDISSVLHVRLFVEFERYFAIFCFQNILGCKTQSTQFRLQHLEA